MQGHITQMNICKGLEKSSDLTTVIVKSNLLWTWLKP